MKKILAVCTIMTVSFGISGCSVLLPVAAVAAVGSTVVNVVK